MKSFAVYPIGSGRVGLCKEIPGGDASESSESFLVSQTRQRVLLFMRISIRLYGANPKAGTELTKYLPDGTRWRHED